MATTEPQLEKREAILDAALHLFAERGFHGTAVPQIAQRAGVAAGTIYRYFDSKEALVNALYQRWKLAMGKALLEALPVDRPVREQFHAVWRQMAKFARDHRVAVQFLELHHHGPYIDEQSRQAENLVLSTARGFFEDTAHKQITKPVAPDVLVGIVYGSFSGLLKSAWSGHLELSDEVLDQAEECVWEAIRR